MGGGIRNAENVKSAMCLMCGFEMICIFPPCISALRQNIHGRDGSGKIAKIVISHIQLIGGVNREIRCNEAITGKNCTGQGVGGARIIPPDQ